MRSHARPRDVPSTPSAASRGQKLAAHGAQWKWARSSVSAPRTLVKVLARRSTSRAGRPYWEHGAVGRVVRGVGVDPGLDGGPFGAPLFDRLLRGRLGRVELVVLPSARRRPRGRRRGGGTAGPDPPGSFAPPLRCRAPEPPSAVDNPVTTLYQGRRSGPAGPLSALSLGGRRARRPGKEFVSPSTLHGAKGNLV